MASKEPKSGLDTAGVPPELEPFFVAAQKLVGEYFAARRSAPEEGTLEFHGERYVLVRAASMSVEFFRLVRDLYPPERRDEANATAREILFDVAHALGVSDARSFHSRMSLTDPADRLSAGPIHFAHTGWAFVSILPESRPSPDEGFVLVYDHLRSFEARAWLDSGEEVGFPVCVMSAGYSSGWCSESFGVPLVASELFCEARGDERCRFLMAPPSRIRERIEEHLDGARELPGRSASFSVPGFFGSRQAAEALRRDLADMEKAALARAAELVRTNRALEQEVAERRRAEVALRRRAELERLVAQASRRFVDVPAEGFDEAVRSTLEAIGRFAGADRAYVFQLREGGRLKDNTHEWCAEGIEPEIDNLQGLPVDDFPLWMEPLKRLEAVHIPRVDDLPESARHEREHLLEQDVQSLVLVPMASGNELVGFLGFDSVEGARDWRPEDTSLLETVGDVLLGGLQRKRSEEALRQAEAHLRELQKMEAVGRLAGGVAHDFNNLLSVIQTNAEFLRRETPPGRSQTEVAEIIEAARRAADLTRQLLAFGRRQVLRPRRRDLNDVVRSTRRMLERLLGEDIQLETDLAPSLRPIMADRGQLEQVIVNLALNARDAMPRGGSLRIETANVGRDERARPHGRLSIEGPTVMLAVSDTGVGMDEQTRERIFEPFFSTKELGKGTGLGLATVYGIVLQSSGEIFVESEAGEGTTFFVYFPGIEGAPQPTPPPVPLSLSAAGVAGARRRILVVEDEAAVRRAATRILSHLDFEVLEAGSGEEALELARGLEEPPDLALCDVVMPGLSGPATFERLRSLWPQLEVLYMSGYPEEIVTRHGLLLPGVSLVEKPFSADQLAAAVLEALGLGDATPEG